MWNISGVGVHHLSVEARGNSGALHVTATRDTAKTVEEGFRFVLTLRDGGTARRSGMGVKANETIAIWWISDFHFMGDVLVRRLVRPALVILV
jgi:hypothetical protein